MDTDQNTDEANETEGVRNLREKLKATEAEAAEAAALRKEVAFLKAGVNTDSKLGQMFFNSYNGELTPDTIRAEATELSDTLLTGSASPSAAPVTDPSDVAQTAERSALAADAHQSGAILDEDPGLAGQREYRDRVAKGERADSAIASVTHRLVDAAKSGDPRAVWTGWSEDQMQRGSIH